MRQIRCLLLFVLAGIGGAATADTSGSDIKEYQKLCGEMRAEHIYRAEVFGGMVVGVMCVRPVTGNPTLIDGIRIVWKDRPSRGSPTAFAVENLVFVNRRGNSVYLDFSPRFEGYRIVAKKNEEVILACCGRDWDAGRISIRWHSESGEFYVPPADLEKLKKR